MAKVRALTPSAIDDLRTGTFFDRETPGLFIEVTGRGKKVWKYRRRVSGTKVIARMRLGIYPATTIAEAREWAGRLNVKTQRGIDPCEERREEARRNGMTVEVAHGLYMVAVREGRASRARRKNKPRTINDKLEVYWRDIAPTLGEQTIYDVSERDLIQLVMEKGKTAKVRANRLAAELKVFFGWAAGLSAGWKWGSRSTHQFGSAIFVFRKLPGAGFSALMSLNGSCVRSPKRAVISDGAC